MLYDQLIGRTFNDKYRIEERLGAGGMGAVYRAVNLRLEQPVAVKVMNPRLLENQEARARFLREAQAAGRVQHPNAVSVSDYGEMEDGLIYLVMEYLEGSSLRQIINAEAPLDPARAVSLMLQVAGAVGAAHEAGVIHRDLKPSNIFIQQRKDAPPSVRLLDFGVAKLLETSETDEEALHYITGGGTLVGTPRYMSPEQCDGEQPSPSSDVYSLGVILYEMLTGATPFTGNTLTLIVKHSTEPPRPLREIVPAIPEALEKITLHALAKIPANRPQDATEFRAELLAVAERLGLEHAQADLQPVLEKLQDECRRSPSGRFVLDLERLREERAAAVVSAPENGASNEAPAAVPPPIEPVEPPPPADEPFSRWVAESQQPMPLWRKSLVAGLVTCSVVAVSAGVMLWRKPTRAALPANHIDATLSPRVRGGGAGAPMDVNLPSMPAETGSPTPAGEPPAAATETPDNGASPATRKGRRRPVAANPQPAAPKAPVAEAATTSKPAAKTKPPVPQTPPARPEATPAAANAARPRRVNPNNP
jgi:serine/threonine-protein kinase